MFEYTCPKCNIPARNAALESGKVIPCSQCGQQLRVVLPAELAVDPPRRRSLMPWLIAGSGLMGLVGGVAIVVVSLVLESGWAKPSSPATQAVAQANTARTETQNTARELPKDTKKTTTDPIEPIKPMGNGEDSSVLRTVADLPKTPEALTGDQVYQRMLKSAVWIVAGDGKGMWTGSGSVIDRDGGLVITNEHVANPSCTSLQVLFPEYDSTGKLYTENSYYLNQLKEKKGVPAKLIVADRKRDLALIQLENLPEKCTAVKVAGRSVSPGQKIYCLGGNPRGNVGQWIFSEGAVRQVCYKQWQYEDGFSRSAQVISSQVPINQGDSGGPCVDGRCVLVGVNAMGGGGQLNSGHIDITEVHDFLKGGYKALGKDYTIPDETAGSVVAEADLQKLIKGLDSPDADTRERAAQLLADMGSTARPAVPRLLTVVRNPGEEDRVRKAAVRALGEIGPPYKEYVQVLAEALQDKTSLEARLYASDALGKLGVQAKPAIPALVQALTDPETDVRRNAAAALGKIGQPAREQAFPGLLALLKDRDAGVRQASLGALLDFGPPSAEQADNLKIVLADRAGPREGRMYAAYSLARLGNDSIPTLADTLRSETDLDVMDLLIVILGKLKVRSKEVLLALTVSVLHPHRQIQLTTMQAVVELGVDGITLPIAIKALQSREPQTQRMAVAMLPAVSAFAKDSPDYVVLTEEIVPDLKLALANPEPKARIFAVWGFGKLGAKSAPAVPELRKVLADDKDQAVRLEAAVAVGEIGTPAVPATAELADIVKDPAAPKNLKTASALSLLKLNKEETKTAYPALAKALLLDRHMNPDPIEKNLHERLQKVLARGGKLGAEVIVSTFNSYFIGNVQDSRDVLLDKINSRRVAFDVLAEIGPDAVSMKMFDLLRLTIDAKGARQDHPAVVDAARNARAVIYKK